MHDPFVLDRVSAKRLRQWMLYEQIEPFGELRADWRAAQIMSMVHNVAVKPAHQKSIEKFLLKFGQETRPLEQKQTPEQQIGIIKILAHALAGA